VISAELREFAEGPEAYMTVPPGFRRFRTERYSLVLRRLGFQDVCLLRRLKDTA
jgi:hypothetical protein